MKQFMLHGSLNVIIAEWIKVVNKFRKMQKISDGRNSTYFLETFGWFRQIVRWSWKFVDVLLPACVTVEHNWNPWIMFASQKNALAKHYSKDSTSDFYFNFERWKTFENKIFSEYWKMFKHSEITGLSHVLKITRKILLVTPVNRRLWEI